MKIKPPKLLVFDFDGTLSCVSSCNFINNQNRINGFKFASELYSAYNVPVPLILGSMNVDNFISYFSNLNKSRNLCIATFGSKAVDLVFLNKIFNSANFSLDNIINECMNNDLKESYIQVGNKNEYIKILIIDPLIQSQYTNLKIPLCPDGFNLDKNTMIKLAQNFYKIEKNNNVVLIDDMAYNCKQAELQNYQTLNVINTGITRTVNSTFISLFDKYKL